MTQRGVGFIPLLFLIFLTLKLTGTIAWSWWLVTMPLWGGFAVLTVIATVIALLGVLYIGGVAIKEYFSGR